MNRSILIVICDFLLVSLLAFSTVDINNVADTSSPRQPKANLGTNQVDAAKDLAAVMRLALAEERKNRDQLLGELGRVRDTAGKQEAVLSEREKQLQTAQQQLQSREQQVQTVQQQLQSREQQVQAFQQELKAREQRAERMQQEQALLQQQFVGAQTNVQTLSQQLQARSADVQASKDKLSAAEAELQKQAARAAALQQQLSLLAQSNQMAEVERRHAAEQVARVEEQLKLEREERTRLADNVKSLANRSGQLEKEIRENRPLAANTIFTQFISNRVEAKLQASRPSLLGGESSKSKETELIFVSDGIQSFALCHVQETPLTLWNPGTDWDGLAGTFAHNGATVPIRSLSFHLQDPRIVWMPVSDEDIRALGAKVYHLTSDPYKFQDAVLVGAREGYYGECRFEVDLSTPEYFRLDRGLLRGLFGKFNPSRGDLVFSRNGELLGIMANGSYCLRLQQFKAAASFQFGPNVRAQRTGEALARLQALVLQMPRKLQ